MISRQDADDIFTALHALSSVCDEVVLEEEEEGRKKQDEARCARSN